MDKRIKLIWDFKGENAFQTAKHHCVHLQEFVALEKLPFYKIEHTKIHDFHSIAYIIVDESNMIIFRNTLKPHRGEIA